MASAGDFSPGLPVEIGKIDRALSRLWEESGDAKTRASLLNLAIYSEEPGSLEESTALVREIAAEHACRAILIVAEPGAKQSGAAAWISAHCHPAGRGAKQICSEQITFHLTGEAVASMPEVVFSHLDSDLPLVFWWRASFPEEPAPTLWQWVDRLIFDSAGWKNAAEEFRRIPHPGAEIQQPRSIVLCDLNWTRLLPFRLALASLFDHPKALARIPQIERIEIEFPKAHRTAALLLLGWISTRLGWVAHSHGTPGFSSKSGGEIGIHLIETDGTSPAVAVCSLFAADARFSIRRPHGSRVFEFVWEFADSPAERQAIPADKETPASLLLAELGRVGARATYLRAFEAVRPFFLTADNPG